MATYFDKFPLIRYSIGRDDSKIKTYDLATNILVRVRVLVDQLDKVFHYYEYTIKDGERPEILADKIYGDPEAHWLILLTNNRTDPFYDWPLAYDEFNKYIISKYGSIENAQTTYHHHNKIFKTVNANTFEESVKTIEIASNPVSNLTINNAGRGYTSNGYLTFPTDYGSGANVSYVVNANGSIISLTINEGGDYIGAPNVSVSGANTTQADIQAYVATANLWVELPTDQGGYTSEMVGIYIINTYQPYRESVTNYDWELEQNENKRKIKLIRPEYYNKIRQEFLAIMAAASPATNIPGIRTVT